MGQGKGRVAIGLSGGVDSAVSAYLLKEAGYDVTGVHLVCWDEGPQCRARDDRKDAVKVAMELGIPMEILDFQKEYKERVIDRFYADYEKGLTPNPDIWCNSEIKFGMFLEWALKNGYDYVATGHYAKVQTPSGTTSGGLSPLAGEDKAVRLLIPKDNFKDQTYFLHRLTQKELSHVLFPLGDLMKSEVREIAKKIKLRVAKKPDSQGICFIGEVDIHEFLKRRLREQYGEVVDVDGKVIGTHTGVWFYTIGQRGGWEMTADYQKRFGGDAPIFYVISKDIKNNRLVVGFGAETYRESFQVGDLNWIDPLQGQSLKCWVRIRHTGRLIPCEFSTPSTLRASPPTLEGENIEVVLLEPERGVAPGQAAVFYRSKTLDGRSQIECLGGGVIQ